MEDILFKDDYYFVTSLRLPKHQVINYFHLDEETLLGHVHGQITKDQASQICDMLELAEDHGRSCVKNNVKFKLRKLLKDLED